MIPVENRKTNSCDRRKTTQEEVALVRSSRINRVSKGFNFKNLTNIIPEQDPKSDTVPALKVPPKSAKKETKKSDPFL